MPPPPRKVRKHFLTRYTVKNGISNLYILLKSALKMQEMPFQRPKFQKISGGACPRTPLQLCRHYGLPLTKILKTEVRYRYMYVRAQKYQSLKLQKFFQIRWLSSNQFFHFIYICFKGLTRSELEYVAKMGKSAIKTSRRDLPAVLSKVTYKNGLIF